MAPPRPGESRGRASLGSASAAGPAGPYGRSPPEWFSRPVINGWVMASPPTDMASGPSQGHEDVRTVDSASAPDAASRP